MPLLQYGLRHRAVLHVQISKQELGTAMSFLRQQLGEDELRHLLEQLSAFGDKCV